MYGRWRTYSPTPCSRPTNDRAVLNHGTATPRPRKADSVTTRSPVGSFHPCWAASSSGSPSGSPRPSAASGPLHFLLLLIDQESSRHVVALLLAFPRGSFLSGS